MAFDLGKFAVGSSLLAALQSDGGGWLEIGAHHRLYKVQIRTLFGLSRISL